MISLCLWPDSTLAKNVVYRDGTYCGKFSNKNSKLWKSKLLSLFLMSNFQNQSKNPHAMKICPSKERVPSEISDFCILVAGLCESVCLFKCEIGNDYLDPDL